MIFLKLFLVFSKIGIFNFGGGYAMLSLIQHEVVERNKWLTVSEFTDIVAISQTTPGPIGINAATYAGYTAVMNDPAGYPVWLGVVGAVVASVAIIWLPFILMLLISKFLLDHSKSKDMVNIFSVLRPAIVGLIAYDVRKFRKSEGFSFRVFCKLDNILLFFYRYAVIQNTSYMDDGDLRYCRLVDILSRQVE